MPLHRVRVAAEGGIAARGDIIAYIDADNVWCSDYLSEIVSALSANPDRDCVYLSQLVENRETDFRWLRLHSFDRNRLQESNYIDLNVFAHRRLAYERYGGFDEQPGIFRSRNTKPVDTRLHRGRVSLAKCSAR